MDNLRIVLAFLCDDAAQQVVNALASGGFSLVPVRLEPGSNLSFGRAGEQWDALVVSTDGDPSLAIKFIQSVRFWDSYVPILVVGESESVEYANPFLDSGANRYIPMGLINQSMAAALTIARRDSGLNQEIAAVKTRLTSAISHEFRNPLTVALSSAELLSTYGETWSAGDRLKQLVQIQTAVQRMNQIVSDILDLQDLEHFSENSTSSNRESVILICQRTLEDVRCWDGRIHPIVFNVHPVNFDKKMDADLFKLVVMHLLMNAVRYSDPGKVITMELSQQIEKFTLVVMDHGLGIPADEIPWVFGRFCRGRNVRKIPGIGLGLTIARLAANQLGGDIYLESKLGLGTRARASFPLH
jgi:signal transduction histidine kinase